jgi:chromosomal replication initiation ATPase DnaA
MKLPQVVSKQEWDHSTVIHAIQVIEKRCEEDPAFHSTLESLEQLIESHGKV